MPHEHPGETDKLKTLIDTLAIVNTSLDLSEIEARTIEAAKRLVLAEQASLLLLDEASGELYFDTATGERGEEVKQIRLKKGEGIAGWVAEHNAPLIVPDVNLDPRFTARVDRKSGFITRDILCVPVCIKNRLIGVLQAINKIGIAFGEEDQDFLTALANQVAVAIENARLYQDLRAAFHSTVQSLAEAMDLRDQATKGHARRVVNYSVGIARVMGMPPKLLGTLKLAAMLHDVGMIGISDELVQRADLSDQEQGEIIKRHVDLSCQILSNIKQLKDCMPVIRHHHEHYDGSGYPEGLQGNQIPILARVIAVADAYDALATHRAYLPKISRESAIERLKAMAGKELDPAMVDGFIEAYQRYSLDQAT
ncbi:MAG: HD domain-containing phosphohydrolase [Pseudomonadota bacterium]